MDLLIFGFDPYFSIMTQCFIEFLIRQENGFINIGTADIYPVKLSAVQEFIVFTFTVFSGKMLGGTNQRIFKA